jgi:hypothetical protein
MKSIYKLSLTNRLTLDSKESDIKNFKGGSKKMKNPSDDHKTQAQAESISPERIVLNAGGKFPRDIIYKTKRGETKIYRIVQTKYDCLTINK